MHYIGVDYHKRYSYLVVKNEEGQVEGRGSVSNTKEEFQGFGGWRLRPKAELREQYMRLEVGWSWLAYWFVVLWLLLVYN